MWAEAMSAVKLCPQYWLHVKWRKVALVGVEVENLWPSLARFLHLDLTPTPIPTCQPGPTSNPTVFSYFIE